MSRRTSGSDEVRSSMVRTVWRSASRSWARASPAGSDTRAPRGYVGGLHLAESDSVLSPQVHDSRVKMVIVVRADLGMGRGKAAAQVAHAAVAATLTATGSPRLSAWVADGQP